MDKNSEKNVRFRINITLLIAVVLLVADLYAMINMPQKFIYSGDHYSIVSGCNLFFGRFHFNLSDGRKESQRRTV